MITSMQVDQRFGPVVLQKLYTQKELDDREEVDRIASQTGGTMTQKTADGGVDADGVPGEGTGERQNQEAHDEQESRDPNQRRNGV